MNKSEVDSKKRSKKYKTPFKKIANQLNKKITMPIKIARKYQIDQQFDIKRV
jgi:hypothetical protein